MINDENMTPFEKWWRESQGKLFLSEENISLKWLIKQAYEAGYYQCECKWCEKEGYGPPEDVSSIS